MKNELKKDVNYVLDSQAIKVANEDNSLDSIEAAN